MAKDKTQNAAEQEAKTAEAATAEKTEPKQTESVYTAEELAESAKEIFGTNYECVAAALKAAGISESTVSVAKEVVKAFTEKEVN